jgi:uncharacterized membrane protein
MYSTLGKRWATWPAETLEHEAPKIAAYHVATSIVRLSRRREALLTPDLRASFRIREAPAPVCTSQIPSMSLFLYARDEFTIILCRGHLLAMWVDLASVAGSLPAFSLYDVAVCRLAV